MPEATGKLANTGVSCMIMHDQGDHSPDNVKVPDGSRHSSMALGMLSVTHIMPVLVVGVGMQQCIIRKQNEMHKFSKVKNGCKYAANNKQF